MPRSDAVGIVLSPEHERVPAFEVILCQVAMCGRTRARSVIGQSDLRPLRLEVARCPRSGELRSPPLDLSTITLATRSSSKERQ